MIINTIYVSFDGEVNKYGIGAPTVFVRTQGCHLRCYKKTKNILCDTPEGLSMNGGEEMSISKIGDKLKWLREVYGVSKVTLTGGDPLMQKEDELHKLFLWLSTNDFSCTVETSGTLPIKQFVEAGYNDIYWVLDYKLPSAGVPDKQVKATFNNFNYLSAGDYVKFVVDDIADYVIMKQVIKQYYIAGTYAVGLFWGSKITALQLFKYLKEDKLLGKTVINFQTHKLILNPDFNVIVPKKL